MNLILLIILELIKPAPNHPLNRDAELRTEIAGYFVEAGTEYNIDPVLLVVWSFGESSLRPDAKKGKLNEIGMFQVHGVAKKICERMGLDVSTPSGQIMCGAGLFDMTMWDD